MSPRCLEVRRPSTNGCSRRCGRASRVGPSVEARRIAALDAHRRRPIRGRGTALDQVVVNAVDAAGPYVERDRRLHGDFVEASGEGRAPKPTSELDAVLRPRAPTLWPAWCVERADARRAPRRTARRSGAHRRHDAPTPARADRSLPTSPRRAAGLNDPNGAACTPTAVCHLCYQHHPDGPGCGDRCTGATPPARDLVTWEHQPHRAGARDHLRHRVLGGAPSVDRDGIAGSGGTVALRRLVYTHVPARTSPQSHGVAVSVDGWYDVAPVRRQPGSSPGAARDRRRLPRPRGVPSPRRPLGNAGRRRRRGGGDPRPTRDRAPRRPTAVARAARRHLARAPDLLRLRRGHRRGPAGSLEHSVPGGRARRRGAARGTPSATSTARRLTPDDRAQSECAAWTHGRDFYAPQPWSAAPDGRRTWPARTSNRDCGRTTPPSTWRRCDDAAARRAHSHRVGGEAVLAQRPVPSFDARRGCGRRAEHDGLLRADAPMGSVDPGRGGRATCDRASTSSGQRQREVAGEVHRAVDGAGHAHRATPWTTAMPRVRACRQAEDRRAPRGSVPELARRPAPGSFARAGRRRDLGAGALPLRPAPAPRVVGRGR